MFGFTSWIIGVAIFLLIVSIMAIQYILKITEPKLIFLSPKTRRVGHGKDHATKVEATIYQDWINIDVVNTSVEKDIEKCWTKLTAYDPITANEVISIDCLRWDGTQETVRADHNNGQSLRFKEANNYKTIPSNRRASTINLMIRPLHENCVYGFTGADQDKNNWTQKPYTDFINDAHKIPLSSFICCVSIYGKDLATPISIWLSVRILDTDQSIKEANGIDVTILKGKELKNFIKKMRADDGKNEI